MEEDLVLVPILFAKLFCVLFLNMVHHCAITGVHIKATHWHTFPMFLAHRNEKRSLVARLLVHMNLPISPIVVHSNIILQFTNLLDGIITLSRWVDERASTGIEGTVRHAKAENVINPVD